ncbi:MAG: adenylate/guanylate cyclase domain-containing protein [bacterium]|nr:adenylate/guanylate cyclase domain-containing protein [bacterium]
MPVKIQTLNFKGVGYNTYTFNKERIRIGRSPENDLVLKDGDVSRNHVNLFQLGLKFYLEDQGSMNGTWIYNDGDWIQSTGAQELKFPVLVIVGVNIILKIDNINKEDGSAQDTDMISEPSTSVLEPGFEKERYCGILVLDICDSTKITNIDEKQAYLMKVQLNRIAMPVFLLNDMAFYKGTGDGFIVTFKAPFTALSVADQLTEKIFQSNRNDPKYPIHFRLALHYGKIYYTDSERTDVHGNDVNLAFRIEGVQEDAFIQQLGSFPKENRILCSGEFRNQVESFSKKFNLIFNYCGCAKLKGIEEAIDIYCISK